MPYPYYPNPDGLATQPVADLPQSWDERPRAGEQRALDLNRYQPDQGLQDAVNAALVVGRPLLLTGDAGTGKTRLADHLAWQLGLGEPLRFETKSTSNARDLFYIYDAVGHFRASQMQGDSAATALNFLTLNPLGLAILLSLPKPELEARGLWPLLERALQDHGIVYGGARRSVVLIDEIDKAPRDFPNDILNEIQSWFFRIPELANLIGPQRIETAPDKRPVVVITSNSEKHLPEPFLRRCVYYHIPFPERERMKKIVAGYVQGLQDNFLDDALALFEAMRQGRLRKKPSTAELLDWLHLLQVEFQRELADRDSPIHSKARPLLDYCQRVRKTLGALIKVREDREEELDSVIEAWADAG